MVLESAEPRDVHHFATLLGYGAQAINPYLAQECVEELVERGLLDKDKGAAVSDYDSAILHGIVKIASKMGISTIQSYQSAQIFEIVGINRAVVDKYFTNTISRVEGVGLEEIGEGVEWNHSQGFDPLGLGFDPTLDSMGGAQAPLGPRQGGPHVRPPDHPPAPEGHTGGQLRHLRSTAPWWTLPRCTRWA